MHLFDNPNQSQSLIYFQMRDVCHTSYGLCIILILVIIAMDASKKSREFLNWLTDRLSL